MATETKTKTFYPGEHEDFNSGDNTSISNPMNPVGKGPDNNTCAYISAQWTTAYAYWPFDVSIIPGNATIDSVECEAKVSLSSDSFCNGKIQLFSGDIAKGAAASITGTNPRVYKLSIETWTRSELNSVRLKTSIKSTRSNRRSILIYGADLTVTYTYNSEKFMLKTGGAWADVARVFKKVSGIWVEQTELSSVVEDGVRYVNGGEIISPYKTITVTGSGVAIYLDQTYPIARLEINGEKISSAGSYQVEPGTVVDFYAAPLFYEYGTGTITLNGNSVGQSGDQKSVSYQHTVTENITVELSVTGSDESSVGHIDINTE